MNMKKSLIALAVAGAFAAPAFAATSNVDVYGVLNLAIESADMSATGGGNNNQRDNMAIVDNVSRIGFKGTEDLGGGMKAVWQIESALSANPVSHGNQLPAAGSAGVGSTGALANRNTFIGLAGGFGTVLMGRHDTPYKLGTGSLDIFGDTIADYNGGAGATNGHARMADSILAGAHDARSPQALAYVSPTWSGFHFAAAAIMTNAAANGQNSTVGKDSALDGISLTGVYSNGPLFASLSYQKVDDADSFLGTTGTDESTAMKLGLGYSFGDAKVGFVYEDASVDVTGGGKITRDAWLVNGVYNMGPIALKAQYGDVGYGKLANGTDSKQWALGLDYNLSKRTTVYFVYADSELDAGVAGEVNVDGWNIGVKHSF
jgi:predicted porin